MGKIIIKTPNGGGGGPGAMIHIPEELWDLAKKHEVYLEDGSTGERYLVIDMTQSKQIKPGFATYDTDTHTEKKS